jgi:hypothetical protein
MIHTVVAVQCLRYRLTIQTVHIFLSPFEKGRLSRAATCLGRAVFHGDAGVVCWPGRLGGICNNHCAANYQDHIITGRKVREDGLQKRR